MGDEYKLTEDEYNEYQELRNQRVMCGDDQPVMSKVKFNGKNIEEFVSKFIHIANAYKTSQNSHVPTVFGRGYGAFRNSKDFIFT